jgi:leucyl/phenylalanyl-tRNA---protein transferase
MHSPYTPAIIDPDMLLLGYRSGIFPMADARDDPEIFWVEPRWRAILPLDGFHLSRSLARALRRERFTVTCNAAFEQVLEHCAAPRADSSETWISERIAATYRTMHERGHAHSIECWLTRGDGSLQLAGGLYGVGFDRVYCGESMFSLAPDASKVGVGLAGRGDAARRLRIARLPVHDRPPRVARRDRDHPAGLPEPPGRGSVGSFGRRRRR